MTTPVFDPEAIARRVFDAEHAAVDEQHEPVAARPHDPYLPGTGQTRGRPLPTVAEGDGSDIFDRLERQRDAKRIHSPIVLRDVPFEPTARTKAERAATDERFRAPSLQADLEELERTDPDVAAAAASYDAMSERIRAKHRGDSARSMHHEPPTEPSHDPRCGEILSGGGAPRGWVLIRVIGSGAPRRYCSPTCAVDALSTPPAALRELVEVVAPPTPRQARRAPVPSTLDVPEIVRRYQAGQTAPEIGRDLGHTAGTIRNALDRAGIQRRDDRSAHSGSQPKDYDPQLVERVRSLYESGLTQAEIGEQIGTSSKVVQNVMERHGIPRRTPGSRLQPLPDHGGGAATRRRMQQIADAGATTAGVRTWAALHGMACGDRGCPTQAVIDAFLAARGVTDEPDERTTA